MDELKIIRFLQNNIKSNKIIDKSLKFFSYLLYFPQNIIFVGVLFYLVGINLIATYLFLAYYEIILYSIKAFCKRKRPFMTENNKDLLLDKHSPKSYSFPSAHATSSYLISFMVYYIYPYKILFLFPFITGLSRIYLGVHYPSDVIIGYLFGYLFQLQILNTGLIKYFFT